MRASQLLVLLSSEHLAPLTLNTPGHDGHDSGGVDDDDNDGDDDDDGDGDDGDINGGDCG